MKRKNPCGRCAGCGAVTASAQTWWHCPTWQLLKNIENLRAEFERAQDKMGEVNGGRYEENDA